MKPSLWNRWRYAVLSGSFALLLIIPWLNAYLGWNFFQGWYQSLGVGDLWIVSPLEGLESLLISRQAYGPLIVGMLIPLLVAILLGRVFCSWICPISFLSESLDKIRNLLGLQPGRGRWRLFRQMLWLSLGLELLLALVLGAPLFVFLSPPGLVGREAMTLIFFRSIQLEGLIIAVVLLLHLASCRFFCRYLCPLGGLLALCGTKRRLRVIHKKTACHHCGACDRSCPLDLKPGRGESGSVYCWNCGTCIDRCGKQLLSFKFMAKN